MLDMECEFCMELDIISKVIILFSFNWFVLFTSMYHAGLLYSEVLGVHVACVYSGMCTWVSMDHVWVADVSIVRRHVCLLGGANCI